MRDLPTVGFLATTFPRDPVEFTRHSEQIGIAQITEPLLASNLNGDVTPLLAESWTIEQDGKLIRLTIRKGIRFSSGKLVNAYDAAYTLIRHWRDPRSQSFGCLADVEAIFAEDPYTLVLALRRPRTAILKALGRDQLGLVPEGWTFDSTADEPYVGTGPYRLIREGSQWFFTKSDLHRLHATVAVDKWRLLLADDVDAKIKAGVIPSIALTAYDAARNAIRTLARPEYKVEEQTSFLQSSIWWYPYGKRYGDVQHRSFVMGLMRELVKMRRRINWPQATGLIPRGVSGALREVIDFPVPEALAAAGEEATAIHIGVNASIHSWFFADGSYRALESRFNVRFTVTTFTERDEQTLPSLQPDVVIGAWFGGFNDPEGFLLILPKLLNMELANYFGPLNDTYQSAMREQDLAVRMELYSSLNRKLVETEFMVPTWRVPTYTLVHHKFHLCKATSRFTQRLADIVYAEESELADDIDALRGHAIGWRNILHGL